MMLTARSKNFLEFIISEDIFSFYDDPVGYLGVTGDERLSNQASTAYATLKGVCVELGLDMDAIVVRRTNQFERERMAALLNSGTAYEEWRNRSV